MRNYFYKFPVKLYHTTNLSALLGTVFLGLFAANLYATETKVDVVVYGATPARVCAAIGAAREGVNVALIGVEPAWMVIGHSAGVAAALTAKENVAVQQLDYAKLRERLLAQKQVLDLPPHE